MAKVKRGKVPPKRGISPLIATVLLVGFVIALVLLIMLWGKNYIEELAAKRGALALKQQECEMVEINIKSAIEGAGQKVTLVIENAKDKPIDMFVFRGLTEGDNSDVIENFNRLGGLEVKQYDVQFNIAGIKKVDIIPELKAGKNKYVPCSDKHVTVKLLS
jgi:flagellin-like protein